MALTKVINSESKQYKPVLVDKLVLDAVPTVNSLNGVTSDAVARAIAGASGDVPQVTENDNGKVLTAIYDEGGAAVEWAEAQGGDVDQTYDATSTNAQSGVAVAQAIAAIPSDVTTASGYFELGGTNPVKVNYTGTPERSITDTPLAVSDLCTYTVSQSLVSQFQFFFINPVGGLRSLDTDTATLKVKVNSILAACNAPSSARVSTSPQSIMYGNNNGNYGGPTMNGSITVSGDDITAQTVTLSGANPASGAFGDYINFGIAIVFNTAEDANTCSLALMEAVQNGEIFEIDWPVVAESGKTITTIPNIPASTSADENKVLTVNSSGNAVWATPATPSVDEVPDVTSTDDGKVLTASYSGGQGSYSWQTAQGGGGGGASYTAGQGIAIDGNNAISVDASASDFTFGQYSTLPKWSNNYNFMSAYYPDSSVICTKDSYVTLARETGNVHLVCDNTGIVAGNYAVCNTNYAFSNWRLTSDVKIELSKTASDWTFTGNTFTLDNGLWYITIAGTTGSTVTPNGEIPVEVNLPPFDTAQFDVITNPNQLALKNSIPTVDQSYNASSTHAQSGTAVAQALASAGGGITWTKITSMTTTSYSLAANFSYSIPSGKTAVQVTLMLRLSNISGSWSNIPKQLSVKLKLTDDYGSDYYYVGSIISADAWSSGSQPTIWMAAGTVVVPRDWFISIDGIQLELPMSGGSLPSSYEKALFVGIA